MESWKIGAVLSRVAALAAFVQTAANMAGLVGMLRIGPSDSGFLVLGLLFTLFTLALGLFLWRGAETVGRFLASGLD